MKTKYILENQVQDGRRILDTIDKVHFRDPVHLEYVMEDDDKMPNRGFDSKVVVDLSKSNYFILELDKFNNIHLINDGFYEKLNALREHIETYNINPSTRITKEEVGEVYIEDVYDILDIGNIEHEDIKHGDYTMTTNIEFINYSNVQRFEILVVKGIGDVSIHWQREGQDVVFPFGKIPHPEELPDMNIQKIISFRLGRSVDGLQQFIAVPTPWFSSNVFINSEIVVGNSSVYNSYIGGYSLFYRMKPILDTTQNEVGHIVLPKPIAHSRIDNNRSTFNKIFRSYDYICRILTDDQINYVHKITSHTSTNNSLGTYDNKDFSHTVLINPGSTTKSFYYLLESGFDWRGDSNEGDLIIKVKLFDSDVLGWDEKTVNVILSAGDYNDIDEEFILSKLAFPLDLHYRESNSNIRIKDVFVKQDYIPLENTYYWTSPNSHSETMVFQEDDFCYNVIAANQQMRRFKCTSTHSPSASNEPGYGSFWETVWEEVDGGNWGEAPYIYTWGPRGGPMSWTTFNVGDRILFRSDGFGGFSAPDGHLGNFYEVTCTQSFFIGNQAFYGEAAIEQTPFIGSEWKDYFSLSPLQKTGVRFALSFYSNRQHDYSFTNGFRVTEFDILDADGADTIYEKKILEIGSIDPQDYFGTKHIYNY